MKEKILMMLAMQDALNVRTSGEDWRDHNRPWYRAAYMEACEMLDHHGWKWWKKQECDTEKVHGEIVDIWHFLMSDILNKFVPDMKDAEKLDEVASNLSTMCDPNSEHPLTTYAMGVITGQEFADVCDGFIATCMQREINPLSFCGLMAKSELTFDELFHLYFGKNILNEFRQDHGYKEGSYSKEWHDSFYLCDGKLQIEEDNVHLTRILNEFETNGVKLRAQNIRDLLTDSYARGLACQQASEENNNGT